MNSAQREAYQAELRRVARQLGLNLYGDLEDAIIQHCVGRVRSWLAAHGEPETLSDLVTTFATSLDMRIAEVRNESDMDELIRVMPPEQKPVIARLKSEFGDETDAVTLLRLNRKPWDQAYLAIINCQGWHEYRRYFSKWHEIGHRLIEGQQLTFAFRHTKVKRSHPEEILVDRVAAALAFFPDMFEPVIREECGIGGRITFETIEALRDRIAPDASRMATTLACMGYVNSPAWFLRCGIGYKASEIRRMNDPQMSFLPERVPEAKLRVRARVNSPEAAGLGIQFFPNMQVPKTSIVAKVFFSEWGIPTEGAELLDVWKTSSGGPIGLGSIHVEAERVGDDEVWAIIHLVGE